MDKFSVRTYGGKNRGVVDFGANCVGEIFQKFGELVVHKFQEGEFLVVDVFLPVVVGVLIHNDRQLEF